MPNHGLLHCLIRIQTWFAVSKRKSSGFLSYQLWFHGQAAFCMPSLILMGSSSLGHTWLTTSPPFLCRTRSRGLAVDAYAPAMAALKRTAISNEMEEGDPCFYLRPLLLQHLSAFGSLEGQIDSAWAFCVCWRWPQLDLIKSGWNPEAFELKASSVLKKHILERDKQICIPDQQGFVLILAMQIRNKHFPLHLR